MNNEMAALLAQYEALLHFLQHNENAGLRGWSTTLPRQLEHGLNPERFGDLPSWLTSIAALPKVTAQTLDLSQAAPVIGAADAVSAEIHSQIEAGLWALSPWRKGPFSVFGIHIDSEWQSNCKWARLEPHLDLRDQLVLDVGCGNGYYALRMLGMGAQRVIGVDPSPRFVAQFAALRQFIADPAQLAADVLPLKSEDLPENMRAFDTAFSMGVLYHRRDPVQHLRELFGALRPGGTLILETLILEDDADGILIPDGRYAQMRNVWAIPGLSPLQQWTNEAGFTAIEVLDVARTSTEEQRRTAWMTYHSLADFLDPADPNHTMEGYPAPTRAILRATRPR